MFALGSVSLALNGAALRVQPMSGITMQAAATLDGVVVPTGAGGLNGLLARRSVAKYDSARSVPADATERALRAAIMAPNHFLSEPWRFYTCGEQTKAKLCGLNEDKRAAAEAVPEWMIVTMTSEHEVSRATALPPARRPAEAASECM